MKARKNKDNSRIFKYVYDRKSKKDKRIYLKTSICPDCQSEFHHRSRLQKKCQKCRVNQ